MMIYLGMILIGFVFLAEALAARKKKKQAAFLARTGAAEIEKEDTYKAVNVKMLTDEPFVVRIKVGIENLRARIGGHLIIKSLLFFGLIASLTYGVYYYFAQPPWLVFIVSLFVGSLMIVKGLQIYDRKQFDAGFPNALNLLNGAVSSGESLMHAIIYVGNSLDGSVGREFRLMGQRLRLGQPAEEVLNRSSLRFPYAPFYFFTITLRANINRGGQLKDIIKRLNQVMYSAQALEKRKGAMTAEARMSAKIVAAIPFFFMGFMYWMSPENFNFVFTDPDGIDILYYVLASEAIGIFIIWFLMKRTQA